MEQQRRHTTGTGGRFPNWSAGVTRFILAVALVNAALFHRPLFAFAAAGLEYSSLSGVLTLATLFLLATFVTAFILTLVSLLSTRLVKPICMVLAIGNSIALYFVETYGVVLDRTMMGNVFNTDVAEAAGLFHPKLVGYVLLLGVVPCLLLTRVQVRPVPILRRLGFLLAALVVTVGWAYANAQTWPWIDKNAKRLGGMTMPWSYVINAARVYGDHLSAAREQTLLPAATFAANEKTVVILVLGEAARAQDFSLYGYPRPTNPQLAGDGVVVLAHTRACSTYTTASLLCILSHSDPGGQLSKVYEPLPSYLQRHGIDVIWRSRNWGEPPLKVQTYERTEQLRPACQGEGCDYDELLLTGLEQRIRSSSSDKVFVVLHQHGSHGPEYYAQYPKPFEAFKPVCRSVDVSHCTREELVNAYDNTIVYTDHFLHRAISVLKAFPETATMLMYISDHGESLGEYGLYLHGTPYSIAPDVQKDVPFLVWMSDAFRRRKDVTATQRAPDASHADANVFHSVMGAFDMRSEIYDDQLDIFGGNR